MDIEARLIEVERRLAAIEGTPASSRVAQGDGAPASSRVAQGDGALWALDGLTARVEPPGAVLLAGTVTLPDGRAARWQEARETGDLLDRPVGEVASALAALGSPIRLRLLLRVLDGVGTVQELLDTEGVGTSGQVYHHLRQLTAAGWVRSGGGGCYEVPPARVVPLLGALLVAGGSVG